MSLELPKKTEFGSNVQQKLPSHQLCQTEARTTVLYGKVNIWIIRRTFIHNSWCWWWFLNAFSDNKKLLPMASNAYIPRSFFLFKEKTFKHLLWRQQRNAKKTFYNSLPYSSFKCECKVNLKILLGTGNFWDLLKALIKMQNRREFALLISRK